MRTRRQRLILVVLAILVPIPGAVLAADGQATEGPTGVGPVASPMIVLDPSAWPEWEYEVLGVGALLWELVNDLSPAPGDMGEDESETPVIEGARKGLVTPTPEPPWNEASVAMAERIRVALRERLKVLGDQGYVLVGSWGNEYLVFVRPRPLEK